MEKTKVIKFSADWCGPCQKIMPQYKKLVKEFKEVDFISVEQDNDNDNLIEKYDITGLPTFIVIKNGVTTKIVGYKEQDLRNAITK